MKRAILALGATATIVTALVGGTTLSASAVDSYDGPDMTQNPDTSWSGSWGMNNGWIGGGGSTAPDGSFLGSVDVKTVDFDTQTIKGIAPDGSYADFFYGFGSINVVGFATSWYYNSAVFPTATDALNVFNNQVGVSGGACYLTGANGDIITC